MRALALTRLPCAALHARIAAPRSLHRSFFAVPIRAQQPTQGGEQGAQQQGGDKGSDFLTRRESEAPARRDQGRSSSAVAAYNDPLADLGLPLGRLVNEFNQIARAFGMPPLMDVAPFVRGGPAAATARPSLLAVDVKDSDDKIEVKADVPGAKPEDIKISVSPDNVLTLAVERRNEVKEGSEEEGRFRVERFYGTSMRRFRLPDNVDVERINAKVKDGELCLTIPKTAAKAPEHKSIQVSAE